MNINEEGVEINIEEDMKKKNRLSRRIKLLNALIKCLPFLARKS